MSVDIKCPIWGSGYEATICDHWVVAGTKVPSISLDALITSGRTGGTYRICKQAYASIQNNRLDDKGKARLTTWLFDQRRQGIAVPVVTDEIVKRFESTGNSRSLSVAARASRLLEFVVESTDRVGSYVDVSKRGDAALAWSESTLWDEVTFLLEFLRERNWISSSLHPNKESDIVSVTVEGYVQVEAAATAPDSAQAFVAMWFDEEMNEAYDQGIEPGIINAGFEPMRIDRKEDVAKIDDEIISEIRRSRFLVAEMTHGEDGARGGVYFEAGFAMGLGIPVLFACKKDKVGQLHFDTRQYFHIVWSEPEELREALTNRIGAIIGDGPNRGNR